MADGAEDGPETRAGREAAKYRHLLRAAESQRDVLAAKLDTVQRAQVDAIVAGLGVRPTALWAAGAQLPDLLDDDGQVDPQRVAEAVSAAKDQFGIRKPARVTGFRSQFLPATEPPRPSWKSAFAPNDEPE